MRAVFLCHHSNSRSAVTVRHGSAKQAVDPEVGEAFGGTEFYGCLRINIGADRASLIIVIEPVFSDAHRKIPAIQNGHRVRPDFLHVCVAVW